MSFTKGETVYFYHFFHDGIVEGKIVEQLDFSSNPNKNIFVYTVSTECPCYTEVSVPERQLGRTLLEAKRKYIENKLK